VRELRNLLERAALLCDGPRIELAQVEQALETCKPVSGWESPARGPSVPGPSIPAAPATSTLKALELAALREQLRSHHGSRAELARRLGISERSLYRKLRALQQAERAAANQKEEDAPR